MARQDEEDSVNEGEIGRRWARVADRFSAIVLGKVADLLECQYTEESPKDEKGPGEDARIRQVSALVIAARRVMELQDRYRQTSAAERDAPDYREAAERDLGKYEDAVRRLLDDERRDRGVDRAAEEGARAS